MTDNPEKLNELKQGLLEVHTGFDPLQPEFLLTVIDLGGWGEISPLQQDRLKVYFTTEMSEVEMAKEEDVTPDAVRMSNKRALEALYQYFVSVRPNDADKYPRDIVTKGKNPSVFGNKGGRPLIHGKYSKRLNEEGTQEYDDTSTPDNTLMIEEA